LFALAGMPALGAPPDGTWSINGGSGGPQALVLHASGSGLTGSLDGTAISNGRTEGKFIWFSAVRGGVSCQNDAFKIVISDLYRVSTRNPGTTVESETFVGQILRRRGARLSALEFCTAVNTTFHEYAAAFYDQEQAPMWERLPSNSHCSLKTAFAPVPSSLTRYGFWTSGAVRHRSGIRLPAEERHWEPHP
jgi:hypothetical protein